MRASLFTIQGGNFYGSPVGLNLILKTSAIHRCNLAPPFVIDTHAHFFNARDVPIRGYPTDPVACSKEGVIGEPLRALAAIAEWIGKDVAAANECDIWSDGVVMCGYGGHAVILKIQTPKIA